MRHLPTRIAFCLLVLLAAVGAGAGRAADPVQFIHSSWTSKDGVPGMIQALAQTDDGYLWLGTYEGLYRFDGVSFERIAAASGHPPGAVPVSALHVMRNGELWVGYAGGAGVEVLKGNTLVRGDMPNPPGEVTGFAEDAGGGIWAIGGRDRNALQRRHAGRWQHVGKAWNVPNEATSSVFPARDGTVWLVTASHVLYLRPGADRFEPTPQRVTDGASMAQDAAGRLWLSDASGTREVPNYPGGRTRAIDATAYPALPPVRRVATLFDRRGALWGSTYTGGVFRIPSPGSAGPDAVAHFRVTEGLTSNEAVALLEDREGNVWIGTELGLDQFRRSKIERVALPPRSAASGYVMIADEIGDIYIATGSTLFRSNGGREPRVWMTSLDEPRSMCRAVAGGFWLTDRGRILRLKSGRVVERLALPDDTPVTGCAQDARSRLWLARASRGVMVRDGGRWKPAPHSRSGEQQDVVLDVRGSPVALLNRRELVGLDEGVSVHLTNADIGVAGITSVTATASGTLIGGGTGMALWNPGGIRRLSVDDHPWLRGIRGVVQAPSGTTWMINNRGILRVPTTKLFAAFRNPKASIPHKFLGELDGLASRPQGASGTQAVAAADGSVWFLTRQSVVRVRPQELQANRLAPPVLIRAITSDGIRIRNPVVAKLAAGTRNLSIDYTALSLSVPSRVAFRYKLDGIDAGWVDPGGRRQAFYTNLGAGTYRFRVVAANEDSVWNDRGAVLEFEIAPTFLQSNLFLLLCLCMTLGLLWLAYALRLRALMRRFQGRMAERLAERERIANDLHDTLLQSVQALILRFSVAADAVAESKMRRSLAETLDRAEDLLIEARDRVSDLREAAPGGSLEDMLHEAVRHQQFPPSVEVVVTIRGTGQSISPVVRDDLATIVGEALFNASRHSHADRVDIELSYQWWGVELRIVDNGVGIPPEILEAGRREGHFGLTGMVARASRIGARLAVSSSPATGTSLTVRLRRAALRLPSTRPFLYRKPRKPKP